jgi:hypothetical protein
MSNIHFRIAKTIEEAKGKIYYVVGRKGSESYRPDIRIEWEGWNISEVEKVSDVIDAWVSHVDAQKRHMIMNPKKGRPPVRTAYHIIINENAHIDFFPYIRDALWNWINREYYSQYMGVVAYHFQDRANGKPPHLGPTFHVHIVINPVPLLFDNNAPMLRIPKHDTSWKNSYYNERDIAIKKCLRDTALMLGGKDAGDGIIEIPVLFSGDSQYIDIIQQSRDSLLENIFGNGSKTKSKNAPMINKVWGKF